MKQRITLPLTIKVPDPSSDRQSIVKVPEVLSCINPCLAQLQGTVPVKDVVLVTARRDIVSIALYNINTPLINSHGLIHRNDLIVVVRIPEHVINVMLPCSSCHDRSTSPPVGGHIPKQKSVLVNCLNNCYLFCTYE